ncbi:type I polyketide synthase [Pseudobacteriovorax antillogorgiicola]|uniref:Enediyne polyketide synthase n=1 Tax=Pseudobacteriovorax antillogorgiicola TaxID=1513793 RepID=A0A1Y6BLQ4_9BACT|nr:type I polyketide synthase [Pseudobacteriovorax antillogorgiicola]TCS54569.1 enediyne polyketide synthase [Pseudobacteriovorax antillogorgiicola]SMF18082.1 enediyne polyketide synthase [Pseudobacteriovorax antillogorgiicola]
MRNKRDDIAVIGISCWYPGAKSPLELWENILSKRQQFRKMPDERLPLDKYHNPDKKVPDMTYGTEAAVIDGFDFDWQGRRIPKKTFEGTDIVHWLALDVALKALKDSGYNQDSIKKFNTGVILGNTLTGEWTRTNAMRMRWPFFRDTMIAAAKAHGIEGEALEAYLRTTESTFKSVFPDVTEDTLAGALSNTIAGRVCNFLDLHGGGYTIDGACSSSLLAVINAARSLSNGDLDVAFAGGIDISLDTFELIGFAKTGALTASDMRVYDKRASGFIPGEGCGFLILKRHEDAVRDGDRIYATLNGWGISSDGKGGLTAPSVRGQSQAIQTAYNMTDYKLNDVDFIEGHGTGTPLGDRVEVGALADALDETEDASVGLTSLKTIIGHTKAAAGIGALIKAVIAVNRRVVPPLAGCEIPHDIFSKEAEKLYPLIDGYSDDKGAIIRAGVSAMGFGGINSHVTLSSGPQADDSLEPEVSEDKLMASYDSTEVFPFSADSTQELSRKVEKAIAIASKMARGEMIDLSADLCRRVLNREPVKAAVIAWKPDDLVEKLNQLLLELANLVEGQVIQKGNIAVSSHAKIGATAFVFPGQGSQKINMSRKLVERHDWAQDLWEQAEDLLSDEGISLAASYFVKNLHKLPQEEQEQLLSQAKQTEIAQPGICVASAIWAKRLKTLGIKADTVAGHSLGELTALWAAGKISYSDLVRIAGRRGQLMAAKDHERGTMAFISSDRATTESLIKEISDDYLVIANLNADDQTIVSGSLTGIASFIKLANDRGYRAQELAVSNAFHSKFMTDASETLAEKLKNKQIKKSDIKFLSSLDGSFLDEQSNLGEYLAAQMLGQVNYQQTVKTLAESHDVIIEVGPGRVLSNLNMKNLDSNTLVLSTDDQNDDSFKSLVANWFVSGGKIQWTELFNDRFVKPLVDPRDRIYIENPCERELTVTASAGAIAPTSFGNTASLVVPSNGIAVQESAVVPEVIEASVPASGSAHDVVLETVHELTGFETDSISMEMRVLDDLNMDSIKASELVSTIAMKLGRPGEIDFGNFANASLQEIVDAADASSGMIAANPSKPEALPAANAAKTSSTTLRSNRTPWVRTFTESLVASPEKNLQKLSSGSVLVIATDLESIKDKAQVDGASEVVYKTISEVSAADTIGKDHIVIFVADLKNITDADADNYLADLHRIAQVPQGGKRVGIHFVQNDSQLVQLKSFASSLHQERVDLDVSYICFADDLTSELVSQKLSHELATAKPIKKVWYNQSAERLTPSLDVVAADDRSDFDPKLGKNDVVLVTGGAKGITAACVLALAARTGSKFALIGSSPLPEEPCSRSQEIFDTLAQFKDAGFEARYYSCDILSKERVTETVEKIQKDLGTITAFIQGAGLNKPAPLHLSAVPQAQKEFKVKVVGAQNFLDVIKLDELKVFASLTSVIGVLGMPGNTWYALANETLDRLSRNIRTKHNQIHTVSLAYSVWDEVGMGAKLGSVDKLETMGISSISPEQGIQRFLDGFFTKLADQQHVITSRMGLAGVTLEKADSFRYVDDIKAFHKNIETVSRVTLSPENDPYLIDHNYKGTYLFPTVFGLEAMAQVVCYTLGLDKLDGVTIENISLEKPITVGPQGDQVEVYAEVLEASRDGVKVVRAGIRCAKTGYKYDHFAADYVCKGSISEDYLGFDESLCPLGIDPQTDLYGPILFQGPSFQRIREIYQLESDDENEGMTVFRADYQDDLGFTTVLGDPYYRDALLQSAQLIIPKNQCLPVKISSLQVSNQSIERGNQVRMALSDVHRVDEKSFSATVKVMNAQGTVLEIMEDYRLQFIERIEDNPRALDLIHDEKKALMNLEAHSSRFERDTAGRVTFVGPQDNDIVLLETLAQRLGLNDDDIKILASLELGHGAHKVATSAGELSITSCSKANDRLVSASLEQMLPCYMSINSGEAIDKAALPMMSNGIKDFTQMGLSDAYLNDRLLGLWKVFLALGLEVEPASIRFDRLDDQQIEFFWNDDQGQELHVSSLQVSNGDDRVYTLVNRQVTKEQEVMETSESLEQGIVESPEAVETSILGEGENKLLKPYQELSKVLRIDAEPNGPQGQSVFVNSFIPDFKTFSNLGRSVYFSHFFNWMGSARELSSVPVLDRIRELTETGKWGLVTNWASINVLGQCRNRDRIVQARMWCGKISGSQESSVTLNFDWVSLGEDGIEERIATGKMGFTWVEILGHGIVKPAPFPDYYREFIDSMVAQTEDQDSYVPAEEPLKNLNPGRSIFQAPKGPGARVLLREKTFETSLFDANLVGNLYFGNYSIWMGKIRDHYFQKMMPEYYIGIGENGEFRCKDSKIQHLREAMPFDDIRVTMSLAELYEGGLDLYFEFFKVNTDGPDEKLAYGEHKIVWSQSDLEGNVKQIPLPEKVMERLKKIIADKTIASVG